MDGRAHDDDRGGGQVNSLLLLWRNWKVASITAGVLIPVVIATVTTHLLHDERKLDAARLAGRNDVLESVRYDSTMVALTQAARTRAAAKLDTVRDTVVVRVNRVRDVIVRVPDSVRVAVPVVDTLIIESRALTVAVDSLSRALDTERAATTLLVTTLRTSLIESRLETARESDARKIAEQRPTWSRTGEIALGTYVIGRGIEAAAKAWRKR